MSQRTPRAVTQSETELPSLLEAALAYAAKGWPVFPCKSNKSPCTKHGVLDATTDKRQIEEWWECWPKANIGLDVGGAGMLVLDLDPGHDLDELRENLGGLPDTSLRAKTPRGGEHLFYLLDDKEVVSPSTSKLAKHVDVRSFNSYVLLAPSVTKDGTYTWESDGKPAFRTDEMVRQSNTYREKHDDRDTWLIEPDMPENIEAAVRWLRNDARIAIEGLGGDHTAYATAAHMKSFGISEATALELIWEHWNPRCIPPWSAEEHDHLEQKVRNAYEYNTSPPGNLTAAYRQARTKAMFKPVLVWDGKPVPAWNDNEEVDWRTLVSRDTASERPTGLGRFRIADRNAIENIRPPEWLFPDFLPQGVYAMLAGGPSSYKTFLALDIALSIATGRASGPWGEPAVSGPVLFTAGEGRGGIKARIQAWEKERLDGNKAKGFYLIDPVPLVSETQAWDEFIALAKSREPDGYKLVVLDTVSRAMQGVNENAQEHASLFTRLVETLQRDLGATVLALHHTGKEGGAERGSSVFRGDADVSVIAERNDKDQTVSLTMRKQKDAPEWEKPKLVQLKTVHLSPGVSSLVAAKPTAEDVAISEAKAEANKPRSRHRNDPKGTDPIVLDTIDKAVADVLASNKTKPWSQTELAEAVAMREEVELSSSQLARRTLKELREDSSKRANKLYEPMLKRWRHKVIKDG